MTRRDRALVVALTALAALVRLPGLRADLWIDEIATLTDFVRLPLVDIARTYTANNHVLYSMLAHLSVALLGEGPVALRLPALLFGVALVPAIFYLGRTLAGREEALAAALLVAVSYHHVYFSQSARGYSGYLCLSVLSTAFLLRALRHGRARHWLGFVLAAAANFYVHLDGVFFLAGQVGAVAVLGTWGLVRHRQRPPALRGLLASLVALGLLGLLCYLPALPAMREFFGTASRNVGWQLFSLDFLRVVLQDVAPGPIGRAAVLLGGPIAIAGLVSYARRAPILLLAVGLHLALRLSTVLRMGVGTYPRAFLIVFPFAILVGLRGLHLTAGWLAALLPVGWSGRLRTAVYAVLVLAAAAAAASGLPRLYRLPKQPYTAALAFVAEHRAPGDVVAAAWVADTGCRYYDPSVRSARTLELLEAILGEGRPVWLLGTLVADMRLRQPEMIAAIESRFRLVERFPGTLGDGAVVVWKSLAAGGAGER